MKEWKIIAYNGKKHIATWTYDEMKDAERAWSHMVQTKTAIDTGDEIETANILMPNGDLYYLGEYIRWH